MKPRIKIETYGKGLVYNMVWPDNTGFRLWVLKEGDWKDRLNAALTKLLTEGMFHYYRNLEGLWVSCSLWDDARLPDEVREAINSSPYYWKIPQIRKATYEAI